MIRWQSLVVEMLQKPSSSKPSASRAPHRSRSCCASPLAGPSSPGACGQGHLLNLLTVRVDLVATEGTGFRGPTWHPSKAAKGESLVPRQCHSTPLAQSVSTILTVTHPAYQRTMVRGHTLPCPWCTLQMSILHGFSACSMEFLEARAGLRHRVHDIDRPSQALCPLQLGSKRLQQTWMLSYGSQLPFWRCLCWTA